jgi:hypothetical protein
MILHEKHHRFFPTSGWGWNWVGDPDRGYRERQPGGWIYNILPFIEQTALHDMGLGKADGDASAKADAAAMTAIPLAIMNCPSRRRAIAYPLTYGGGHNANNADSVPRVARNDYAANAGDAQCSESNSGPSTYAGGDAGESWPDCQKKYTGVSYIRSQVTTAALADGVTATLLAGEKFINPDLYTNGNAGADNSSLYQGHDWDIIRWGGTATIDPANASSGTPLPPLRDRTGADLWSNFGSAHSSGFHAVFGDNSVRQLRYSIDPKTFQRLTNRKDGTTVDVGSL